MLVQAGPVECLVQFQREVRLIMCPFAETSKNFFKLR
jgi:hypothetical protein